MKNNLDTELSLKSTEQFSLSVTANAGDTKVPYKYVFKEESIKSGQVSAIIFEILKKNFDGKYLDINAMSGAGSLFGGYIKVER